MSSEIKVDTISENTSANGVAIDGVTIKDGNIGAAGTTTTLAGIAIASENNSIFMSDSDIMDTTNTAAFDTVYGWTAGNALTTGDSNTLIGYAAGTSITTGQGNIMIGESAGDGFDTEGNNLGVGNGALGGSIAGGEFNVAIGNLTLDALTSADSNVAIGFRAGTAITSGASNVIVGKDAAQSMTEGHSSVIVGENAGNAITTGNSLVFIGKSAGSSITTGGGNVFIGHETGVNSIAVDTGTDNILIGFQARANQTNAANQISLGKQVTCQGDNNFTFGNGATDSNIVFGATSITAPSDERYKEEIATSTAGLSFINDLRPVTFKWKKEKDLPPDHEAYVEGSDTRVMLSTGETNHGFIAQEVKAAIDAHSEIKDGFKMWSEDQRYDIDGNIIEDGRQRVAPSELIPVLTKAVQELSDQITTLQQEIKTIKGE